MLDTWLVSRLVCAGAVRFLTYHSDRHEASTANPDVPERLGIALSQTRDTRGDDLRRDSGNFGQERSIVGQKSRDEG